jgi:hypothetical protein
MTSVATDTANDVGSEILGVRAVILAMANFAAVLASLVLVVTKGTVERGEFTQLVSLELVLAFGDGGSLWKSKYTSCAELSTDVTYSFNDLVNELFGFCNLLLGIGHNQAVEVLVLVAGMGSIGLALTFLDGALSANSNLGQRLGFHVFQSVSTGTDE